MPALRLILRLLAASLTAEVNTFIINEKKVTCITLLRRIYSPLNQGRKGRDSLPPWSFR